jgi:CheY-like chemotaxis protein
LAALAATIPDLILLDLLMPGMSGSELLAYLRTHGHAEVPVVIMTADTKAAQLLAAQEAPRCLIKPFTLDALLDCVARAIRTNGNSKNSSAA